MNDFSDDIKRYLSGEMTPAERHALEKKALSDPFLADALEGAEQVKVSDWMEDVNSIHQKINTQAGTTKEKSTSSWAWTLRIAATLLLLVVSTFVIYKWTSPPKEESSLALIEKVESTTPIESDAQIAIDSPSQSPVASSEKIESRKTDSQSGAGVTKTLALAKEEPTEVKQDIVPAGEFIKQPEAEVVADDVAEEPIQVTEKAKEERIADVAFAKKITVESERKTAARAAAPSSQLPSSTVQGKITSAEDGSPLPGVNVVIKGTTIGTVTDVTGNYTLENKSPSSTLVYSFIGLQSKEVPVGDRQVVDVEMDLDVTQLSEVVVTGYGYSEKSETTPTVDLAHPSIGTRAYKKYLEENLRYPKLALDNSVEGRVTVEFFVESDGHLSGFTIIRGIGSGCDEELIRLIQDGPSWVSTKKEGAAIRDKARIRLKFALPKD